MKAKLFLQFSILSIAISIILGAFGAHALKDIFNDYSKEIWEKGILYQLTNSLGLLLIIILQNQNQIVHFAQPLQPFYNLVDPYAPSI